MLDSLSLHNFSTLIKNSFNGRKRIEKTQVTPKKQLLLKLPREWGEESLKFIIGLRVLLRFWFQLPMPLWCWIKDLDLMVRKYRPLGERQLPGKLGQPWGCSDTTRENQLWFTSNNGIFNEGFTLTYLSFLINRVKLNTRKALLPWMKFYPRVNVTDYASPLEEDKMSLQVPWQYDKKSVKEIQKGFAHGRGQNAYSKTIPK